MTAKIFMTEDEIAELYYRVEPKHLRDAQWFYRCEYCGLMHGTKEQRGLDALCHPKLQSWWPRDLPQRRECR